MLKRVGLPGALLVALSVFAQHQAPSVRSITFKGNQGIDSARLKSAMRLCREGGVYQSDGLRFDLINLERFYKNEGFLKAEVGNPAVEIQQDPGQEPSAAITIPVSEGPLFTTGKVAIRNSTAFEPEILLRMCPLKEGQAYRRNGVAQWVEKIEEGYRAMGYLRFSAKVREEVQEQINVVHCTLDFAEGSAYSVGRIVIEGDPGVDRSDFRKHLLVGEGGLYNPEMVYLSLQYLNQMGKYRYMSERDVEVKVDDARSTVDLIFHVALAKPSPSGNGPL